MIDIELEGDWPGVSLALKSLPLAVRSSAIWGQRKATEQLVKTVKKHINAQDLGWQPRSAKRMFGDPRILVDEEAYYGAIKAWKEGDTYIAGVPSNATNSKGDRIVDYALMNEFGGGNLPSRPLWGPSIEELGGPSGLRSIVTVAIYQKLAKLRALGLDIRIGKL